MNIGALRDVSENTEAHYYYYYSNASPNCQFCIGLSTFMDTIASQSEPDIPRCRAFYQTEEISGAEVDAPWQER